MSSLFLNKSLLPYIMLLLVYKWSQQMKDEQYFHHIKINFQIGNT